jgi:hypothetical protein
MQYGRKWTGPLPDKCQLCDTQLKGHHWVDGRCKRGSWAYMCLRCHAEYGYGLGTGQGQKYNDEGWSVEG